MEPWSAGSRWKPCAASAGRAAHHDLAARLGLIIVKTVAERHGGNITVDSQVGVGSTFELRLPLRGQTADPVGV